MPAWYRACAGAAHGEIAFPLIHTMSDRSWHRFGSIGRHRAHSIPAFEVISRLPWAPWSGFNLHWDFLTRWSAAAHRTGSLRWGVHRTYVNASTCRKWLEGAWVLLSGHE
jgi:hypothetical protein